MSNDENVDWSKPIPDMEVNLDDLKGAEMGAANEGVSWLVEDVQKWPSNNR